MDIRVQFSHYLPRVDSNSWHSKCNCCQFQEIVIRALMWKKEPSKFIKKVNTNDCPTLASYILKLQCLSVCVGSAWKILPVTARSLWSVLGGGGRESPVKHGAGGPARAGEGGTGGEGPSGGELDGCIMHRVHTSDN
jgi:hypothetical protein